MFEEHAAKLEQKLGIIFENKLLLSNAFIHRSHLNENRTLSMQSNERLEFLGDACLELVVSRYLYETYPTEPEGTLTSYRSALVNTTSLAESARALNLGEFLLLSKGEEAGGGRESEYLLANTFEALIGAIYIDRGYESAQHFVSQYILTKLDVIIATQAYKDPKSLLQEMTQAQVGATPDYQIIEEWGPDHDKNFKSGVFLNAKLIGEGIGSSKQKAELQAAHDAVQRWKLSTEHA